VRRTKVRDYDQQIKRKRDEIESSINRLEREKNATVSDYDLKISREQMEIKRLDQQNNDLKRQL
jgi:hypothetical protein